MKRCSACDVVKPLESFYKYKRRKDGHLGICKRCFLARQATYKVRKQARNRWQWMTG